MRTGTILLALAGLGVVVVAGTVELGPPKAQPAPASVATPAAATAAPSGQTLVYYFHGTARCATCRKIEAYAREAVEGAFAADLEARRITWQAVDVDEPANQHFIGDFDLYTRSLVVVDAGDPKRFKVLERVWELVRDEPAFRRYVEQEIHGFRRP
jgi:hypothetical protein